MILVVALLGGVSVSAQSITGNVESGNIDSIVQSGPNLYDLTIRPDTGAASRQWFHFAVSDAGGMTLTFVLNNVSISAPWTNGMAPCVSTDISDETSWTRVPAADVSFATQDVTFSYTFPDDSPHHFAYAFVYPVSRAEALADNIAASPYATQRVLTQKHQGRDVDLLEITEGNAQDKMGIWIQARQHPAEAGSSWACEGFLEWLVGDSAEARALRQGAVLRVVPMMNPDGVALGNYRTNLLGYDLNREWDDATPATAPTVAAALLDIADLEATVGLDIFLDLHTHSSVLSNWVYGVNGDNAFDVLEQGLAQAIELAEPDFSFAQSSFSNGDPTVAKNHIHTLHPEALSYTHEQTYHTITYGPNAHIPVTVERYETMGRAIGQSVVSFFELPLDAWVDVGDGLAGAYGEPQNSGSGSLLGGTPVSFDLTNAAENTTAYFVFGVGTLGLPFKGGVLVPDFSPPGLVLPLPTGPSGAINLATVWPLGLPGGITVASQWWVADPAGPSGFAASNGLVGVTP